MIVFRVEKVCVLRRDNAVHLTMFGWSSSFNTATSRIMWLGTPSSSLSILSFFSVMMSPVTRCRACGAEETTSLPLCSQTSLTSQGTMPPLMLGSMSG